jgi:hypothetical protein
MAQLSRRAFAFDRMPEKPTMFRARPPADRALRTMRLIAARRALAAFALRGAVRPD